MLYAYNAKKYTVSKWANNIIRNFSKDELQIVIKILKNSENSQA